jgi:hypothetical protein
LSVVTLALDAGWDDEMLRVELASLQEDGFNLDVIGFTDEEMENLLCDPEDHAGLTDEDAVPDEPERAITVPRDVWMLGDHRLLCGDATQMAKKLTIGNDALGEKFYESTGKPFSSRAIF